MEILKNLNDSLGKLEGKDRFFRTIYYSSILIKNLQLYNDN